MSSDREDYTRLEEEDHIKYRGSVKKSNGIPDNNEKEEDET